MNRTETAIQKLSQAEKWLSEAKGLDELKQIHDIAIAAESYAQAHRLGLESENHAREIKFLAARKMGELCLPIPPAKSGKMAHGKEVSGIPDTSFPEKQRLSEFRKLAKIPEPKFRERMAKLKAREEKISYTKLLSDVHISHARGENEWYTPAEYVEPAHIVMGEIDYDPASSEIANKIIKAKKFHTAETNGLKQKWGKRVWMNPPYSQPLIYEFCEALISRYETGEIEQACVLLNNATETIHFQRMLEVASAACFIRGRIKYLDETGIPNKTPLQGQIILYFGKNDLIFKKEYSSLGIVLHK